jgi:PAS domain S-box-containing protein
MFDPSGTVTGIAGISRDITAQKSNEDKLWEQSEQNRMILETAHDAFIGMDREGSITAWNPQAERTFGWAAAEIRGQRLCDTVIAPADREIYSEGLGRFLKTANGSFKVVELTVVNRGGREFPVEATVWPSHAGGALSFNAFVRDISERRRTEEARKKEATLIQLLQEVTVAANRSSNIRHTARTCLGLICAYIGWPVGHIYLRGEGAEGEFVSGGLWQMGPAGPFENFREASENSRLAPGVGLSSGVLASGMPEWIVNLLEQDHRSPGILFAADRTAR